MTLLLIYVSVSKQLILFKEKPTVTLLTRSTRPAFDIFCIYEAGAFCYCRDCVWWELEVQFHSLFTLELEESEWSDDPDT